MYVGDMTLPPAEDHARRFAQVRLAHRTEVQEDYVELIADLIAEQGEARAVDLAERLGVTAATVANTLARLKRDALIENKPYRSIFLTPASHAGNLPVAWMVSRPPGAAAVNQD